MKTPLEENLLNAFIELDNAVKAMPAADPKPNLLPLFARIDELTKQLPRDADPALLHYCTRKVTKRRGCFCRIAMRKTRSGNCRHV